MNGKKVDFRHIYGTVEGIYHDAGNDSPLVIIINGHNGFYNYGMFPYIQQKFMENGISSYSFNFSHGGVIGDADHFEDLEKYEQNCMRLETEDLVAILQHAGEHFKRHPNLFLFAHSLGGVPTLFGAKKAAEEKIRITGIILISTVKTLNFWPSQVIKEWALAGVYYKKNNRTLQELPQGFEFLQEIVKSETQWNIRQAIQSLSVPILIIHGSNDEAVPAEHGETIYSWIKDRDPHNHLLIIPGASHTYNTKHPFEKTSDQLEELLKTSIAWIRKLTLSTKLTNTST